MLYPIQNAFRNRLDISGIWDFQPDPQERGLSEGWANGLPDPRPIAVPGSWNEQYADLHDYFGLCWYVKRQYIPSAWRDRRVFLRVGSACYQARVFVNGEEAGSHSGGHLPFAFEVNDFIRWDEENVIAIAVENRLLPTRVPSAGMGGGAEAASLSNGFPSTTYDFFPFAGIHRPVVLYTTPRDYISDVTVTTEVRDGQAKINVAVEAVGSVKNGSLRLSGGGLKLETPLRFSGIRGQAELSFNNAHLWSDRDPFLYDLTVSIKGDEYSLKTGVRTIKVADGKILLNDQPVQLKGFGRHEDFYASGKGLNLPLLVKDYDLMHWCGANSYRTSHYPYSEEEMQMADRQGFLIIDECPAVSLQFDTPENMQVRLEVCKAQIEEMIVRDKNHACVVMWSVANEPMPADIMAQYTGKGLDQKIQQASRDFLKELVEHARALDHTRPVTLVGVMGGPSEWFEPCDVVCINRYWGWYIQPGELEKAFSMLDQELDDLWDLCRKPLIVTEFGADTQPGLHSQPPVMWSEEYQAEFIRGYLRVAARKPFVCGMHVWNFADFAAVQSTMRVGGMNLKGVFTRSRQPKMAAQVLREFWTKPHSEPAAPPIPEASVPDTQTLPADGSVEAALTALADRMSGKKPELDLAFKLEIQDEGVYRLIFEKGTCRVEAGEGESAAGMRMKYKDALRLFNGQLDPMVAVMTGKVKTSGDARLLLTLRDLL